MPLYDQFGRELRKEHVVRGARAETLDERKRRWQKTVATGLTPHRLGHILRQAEQGDNVELLTFALEAPERDADLFADLQTRSLAIWGAPLRVDPVEDNARGKEIAERCQKLVVNKPEFRWLLQSMMSALLPGYAVIVPIWDTSKTPWTISEYQQIDVRHFMFDKDTLRTLRLRTPDTDEGRPLPRNYLVHYPHVMAGLPLRSGLVRIVAVNHLAKTSKLSDWLSFAEVFGQPLRMGRYNPDTVTDDELATLREAIVNMGHDAACMMPDGMSIEILDARRPPSGENVFQGIASYFDNQRQRAILGSAPSLEGSSAGQGASIAETRREVRADIREADALACSATADHLLNLWAKINFGQSAPELHLHIDVAPAQDIQTFTAAILPWLREAQVEVPERWLKDRLQIPEAKKGEKMIKAPLLPGATGGDQSTSGLDGSKRGKPSPGKAPKP